MADAQKLPNDMFRQLRIICSCGIVGAVIAGLVSAVIDPMHGITYRYAGAVLAIAIALLVGAHKKL